MRPDWDTTWMNVARVIAQRAPCSRARVGAVIVDPTNRIVATGYNGPPAGFDPMEDGSGRPWDYECDGREGGFCVRGKHGPTGDPMSYADCPSLHAEENALSFCDRRDREFGTIYVTGTTCISCAKLIANSGLKRVVMLSDESRTYRVSRDVDPIDFMKLSGIGVLEIVDA